MKQLLIYFYFYVNSGVLIINDFRNIGLGIFAFYFTLHFTNPVWLLFLAGVSLPVLWIMGYYNVHHISKVRDRLNIKYGTHYGIKQFEFMEEQVSLLKEIKEKLCQK